MSGHKINQICGMVSHWIFTTSYIHILVRKVVWFKIEIPANENSGDFDGDGDGDGEDKLGKRGPVLKCNVKHTSLLHSSLLQASAFPEICSVALCLRSADCPLYFSLRSHNIYWEIIFSVLVFLICVPFPGHSIYYTISTSDKTYLRGE